MNVLIIPEDFRNDQYILKPLFDRTRSGQTFGPHPASVEDPLLGGVREASEV